MKETITWLAGLISTDGAICKHGKNTCSIVVTSTEREWLKVVQSKLAEIGIKSTIQKNGRKGFSEGRELTLWIWDRKRVLNLFKAFNVQSFFIPRKWRHVEKYLKYYNSEDYQPNRPWMEEEEEFIRTHMHLSDSQIAKALNRGSRAIVHRRDKLNLKKGQGWRVPR